MTAAEEQYKDFVDVSNAELTISQFKTKRGLPLNEQYFSVLYAKTAHLKDSDFVQIDRPILQMIGFKNSFCEKKDKNGNVIADENGNPILKDMRSDFFQANRCLRNTAGFKEGSSFDDDEAHFVIQKLGKLDG